jgi:hypothetical protein
MIEGPTTKEEEEVHQMNRAESLSSPPNDFSPNVFIVIHK